MLRLMMLLLIILICSAVSCPQEFKKYIQPTFTIIDPISSIAVGQTCTNSSKHNVCTCKCEYSDLHQRCIPQSEQDFCNFSFERICPEGCKFDLSKGQCIPTMSINICEIDLLSVPPRCPIGCIFFNGICKGYGCDNIIKTRCDAMCGVGKKCCGGSLCRPDYWFEEYMNTCEPTIKAECPFSYVINVTAPICTRINRNRLCKVSEIRAEYPKSLGKQYENLQCKSLIDIDC